MAKAKTEAKGDYLKYNWMIIRQGMGHLCGYVKLWKNHPLNSLVEKGDYDSIDIDVHGGLTFACKTDKGDEFFDEGYWIGWDYAHWGDYVDYGHPELNLAHEGDHKWTVDEVIKECYEVIDQLTEKYT